MWRSLVLFFFSMPAMAAVPICQNSTSASVLLELYTSEGCSSCPPADAWLAKVPQRFDQERVISLAWHVDYWDYLGWKDELANPQYSARQRERVRASGSDNMYTPQLMVNGHTHFWSKRPEVLIQQQLALSHPSVLQLSAQAQNKGAWLLSVKTTSLPADTLVRAVLLGATVSNKIGGGENSGRTLSHASPVLAYARQVNGSVVLNPKGHDAVRAVVWLERENKAEVLAVSSVDLNACLAIKRN
jgi:hypothetical protein